MNEPSTKTHSALCADANDPSDENERPTVPFDLEAFARANTAPGPDSSTTRPPPPAEGVREALSESGPAATASGAEAPRAASIPNSRLPAPRSPSALWMVDSLVSSAPPPARGSADSASDVEPAVSVALASVSEPQITELAIEDPIAEMRERASLGDYSGALEMADIILAVDPQNEEASECVETCRSVLEKMYSAKLGPLDRAPIVVVPRAQLRWLSIDHRAGFILSLIDGVSPIEMIIDVSGMPKMDALRILHELVQQRIVSFET